MKEINHQVKFLYLHSQAKINNQIRRRSILGIASTFNGPIDVNARYIRETGISVVSTVVHIESETPSYRLKASVEVKIRYEGDAVRSSSRTRADINKRLEYLVQSACAHHIHEKLKKYAR